MAGGTAYSAVDSPRGDHLQCHGWSGGTKYSAMYGPGGPLLGGTTCSMTARENMLLLVNHILCLVYSML